MMFEVERNGNGVRQRHDGRGDPWANNHRDNLSNSFLMNDFDAVMGCVAFAHNTADRVFCEYEPDAYKNRRSLIRQFAVVALFDRKKSESTANGDSSTVSTAFYLWLTRMVGEMQPIAPKFFHVIGGDKPPYTMIERSLFDGSEVARHILTEDSDWKRIWEACGLISIRQQLKRWILSEVPAF